MSKLNHVIIEKNKKFSESYLWEMQRRYFDKEGVDAWVNDVPFYATSNPFLAGCYASMSMRLMQDWVKKHPEAKQHPFYIIELGTGSGILSFHTLNRMMRIIQRLRLEDIKICYVMTDYAGSNLKYWETHPGLQKYIDSKMLDFALFDMEKDTTVTLKNAGTVLTPGSVANPIIVFANYIFDTVSQDAFAITDSQLYASLVTLSTDRSNIVNGKPVSMEEIKIEYENGDLHENYYEDPTINATLLSYRDAGIRRSHFLFPTAGLIALSNLKKLSNDKLFLLSTDKAYSYIQELENLGTPDIAFHGSFSTMVNFHAIAKYFELAGGKSVLQTQRAEVNTAAFYVGIDLDELPEFANAVYEHVERLSPGDYFALHRNIRENFKHCPINSLAAHMAFADWDPHIFGKISKQIISLLPDAEHETKIYLANHMPELASNYYYMPKIYDVWFDIGIVFHTLRRYSEAVYYYQQSIHFYGEQFNSVYNLAICFYNAGEVKQAQAQFKRALQLNEDSKETKEWIEFIKKEEDSKNNPLF
ncbi:MAG TPA: hypothetical protein VHE99_10295 [Gammaproteobacteria bacterium]|nr:hypothetical protein [Gammaproteobacteria bacterium]